MNMPDNLQRLTKLNVGCGYDKKPGYLNIDVDPACAPDLLIREGDDSAIPRGHFVEVFAKDVLEHIARTETLGALLRWSEYLTDRGALIVSTSSILGVAHAMQTETKFDRQYGWTQCLFGTQAHPGDFHYTGFTETTLRVHLMAAGFHVSGIEVRDNWLLWAFATKASDWTDLLRKDRLTDGEFTRQAYRAAFGREPDESGATHVQQLLASRQWTRYDALRHIYKSPERLFVTAQKAAL